MSQPLRKSEESTAVETPKTTEPNVRLKVVHPEQFDRPRKKRLPKPEMVDANSRILWEYLIPVTVFHLMIPLAFLPSMFSWWGVLFLPVGNYLFTSLGIGAGYHRLLTHRGFECPKWLEYTLSTLGVCSLQDTPARWTLVHRVHHQHSDHQPDPHTPNVSAFWSHMGWLFIDNRELSTSAAYDRYVRDVMKDPYYFWLQRNLNWVKVYAAHAVAISLLGLGVGLAMTGSLWEAYMVSLQFTLWGVVMRTVYCWHVTWGINSVAHMWGYRNYETREDSRNNWLFALLTNGEGWHNNHHADPRSARHGHRWWELDLTWATLRCWEMMGLVTNLVRPRHHRQEQKRKMAA
ncbi:acyl-CoA desaturase [Rubinisphaera sp. JC750]|uniref:acyl-CoA desaturase n=1 Tax=Rubinisphaera sp. JC750 TaxID=2898658 RepID=UPI001F01A1AA|nr:fatty acid desaturase [Rubinisphaera sp. JC750]